MHGKHDLETFLPRKERSAKPGGGKDFRGSGKDLSVLASNIHSWSPEPPGATSKAMRRGRAQQMSREI